MWGLRLTFWKKPKRVAALVLFVGGALGVAAAMHGFQSYVRDSPRFCQSCHDVSPEIAVWVESKHREVRCQRCHHNTVEEGLHTLFVFISGGEMDGDHAKVDVQSCAGCHASHDSRWPSIANSRGHLIHADNEKIVCTRCHGQEMHFDRPPRKTCLECHEGQALSGKHGSEHCLACHNFLTTDAVIKPQRSDCLHCHKNNERPIVIDATAPMQLQCSACHRPHSKEKLVSCQSCHPQTELVGLHNLREHQKCSSCHAAHEWTSTKEQCFACHPDARSHHPNSPCGRCHSFAKGLAPWQ